MSAAPLPPNPQTNTIHIDSEPCHRIIDALIDSESDEAALAIILPILSSEPIVHASTVTKYGLIEQMLIGGDTSDSLKLAIWNTIKDSPIWLNGFNEYLDNLVESSSLNSPFPIFQDLYFRWKSQSDAYKSALECKRLNGRDDEHRQLIEHEKQLLQHQPESC